MCAPSRCPPRTRWCWCRCRRWCLCRHWELVLVPPQVLVPPLVLGLGLSLVLVHEDSKRPPDSQSQSQSFFIEAPHQPFPNSQLYITRDQHIKLFREAASSECIQCTFYCFSQFKLNVFCTCRINAGLRELFRKIVEYCIAFFWGTCCSRGAMLGREICCGQRNFV